MAEDGRVQRSNSKHFVLFNYNFSFRQSSGVCSPEISTPITIYDKTNLKGRSNLCKIGRLNGRGDDGSRLNLPVHARNLRSIN